MTEKTFLRITNKDIYLELKSIKRDNTEQHSRIINHQIKTNGKVMLNRWVATTALGIVLITLGFLVNHLI